MSNTSWQRAVAIMLPLAATLALGSCASAGLGVDGEDLPREWRAVHQRAALGDKQAQYELALLLARGVDGEPDCVRSRRVLALAARDEGGSWVNSPPVGSGASGRVAPLNTGARPRGLAKARELLADPSFCPLQPEPDTAR